MKIFQVLSLKFTGSKVDWSEAEEVKSFDHESAAELWAELSDQDGDYDIIIYGSHGPVLVREMTEDDSGEVQEFNITAYNDPVYQASVVRK